MTNETISRNEIRDSLLRSGYLLESRVEGVLREKWGYVEANASYEDPDTGKSREFDVYALNALSSGTDEYDYLFGVLIIECINNPQPIAFITKDPLIPFMHHETIKMSGLPVKVAEDERGSSWQLLSDYLDMKDYHHYCTGRIATQYCSFLLKKSGKIKEWIATHDTAHFDAIKKLCDATDYYMDRHFSGWTFEEKEPLNIEFYYPILLVQGELLDVRQTEKGVSIRSSKHLQYRRSVVIKGEEIEYFIDVIEEEFLPKFLSIIDDELSKTADLLQSHHERIRMSIDLISSEASGFEGPEKIKEVMKF